LFAALLLIVCCFVCCTAPQNTAQISTKNNTSNKVGTHHPHQSIPIDVNSFFFFVFFFFSVKTCIAQEDLYIISLVFISLLRLLGVSCVGGRGFLII
jgi:hypothetical protein